VVQPSPFVLMRHLTLETEMQDDPLIRCDKSAFALQIEIEIGRASAGISPKYFVFNTKIYI
jgi:hypothetical protein